MSETNPSDTSGASSPGGATETTSSQQTPAEKLMTAKAAEALVRDRLRKSHDRIAELEAELGTYRGEHEDSDAKPDKSNPSEADWKSKLQRMELKNKALVTEKERYRQSTLKAAVVQKLIEKDCLDPELGYIELSHRNLVKLNDDDEVVSTLGGEVDDLIDDYLSKKDYLRRSKLPGGIGSHAPGIITTSTNDAQMKAKIAEIRAAKGTGRKLFGH